MFATACNFLRGDVPTAFSRAEPLLAIRYFRQMRWGSRASLVECSDGALYVLRTADRTQEPNRLANEYLGTALCEAVGLPVPGTRSVLITESFLTQSSNSAFGTPNGFSPPSPGLHLGSHFLGERDNTSRVLQVLAPSHILRITNRESFLGMYLLDVATNCCGRRQALFVRDAGIFNLMAYFVDHGQMFGGALWDGFGDKCLPLHTQKSVYLGLWDQSEVDTWIAILQRSVPSKLMEAVTNVPQSWFVGDVASLTESVCRRLDQLPDLAYEYALREAKCFGVRPRDQHGVFAY